MACAFDFPATPEVRRADTISLTPQEVAMLRWALLFLVIAIIAAVFGFGGIAGVAADIARILFFVFLVLFIVSLLTGWVRQPPVE
jgi:uncharacterized membrane protein YtjA (UPF0391 family)